MESLLTDVDVSQQLKGLEPLSYKIEVSDPQVITGLTKHIEYLIKATSTHFSLNPSKVIDDEGTCTQKRRYSDFYTLRKYLKQRWPGCYIPPIPPKTSGSMEKDKVKERLLMLNLFCNEMVKRPHLYHSKEFQTFLRTPLPAEKALK